MTRMLYMVLAAALIVLLVGCIKPVVLLPTGGDTKYPPTKLEDVTFTTKATVDKPFNEIGFVYAQGLTWKEALRLAKEKTSSIGGHAIVNGRGSTLIFVSGVIIFVPIYQTMYIVEGTAIRYEGA
jgi:hypothetical protein